MACCTLVESFAWTYCQDCGASWQGPDRKALATEHILGRREERTWRAEEQPERREPAWIQAARELNSIPIPDTGPRLVGITTAPNDDNVFKRLLREHPEGGGEVINFQRQLELDALSADEVIWGEVVSALTGHPVPTPRERAEEKVRVLLEWDAPTKALAWRMLKADGMSTARSDMLIRDAKWNLP